VSTAPATKALPDAGVVDDCAAASAGRESELKDKDNQRRTDLEEVNLGFPETPKLERIGVMNTVQKYSPEVRQRAVRLVFEHQTEYESQWAAVVSIASQIGCTAETLRKWVRQAERDQGKRAGLTSSERVRLKELEREVSELKRANEMLRQAAAFFAQAELDRRPR